MPPEHEIADEDSDEITENEDLEQKQSSEETPEKNTVEESPSLSKPPGSPGASRSRTELKELKSSNPYLRKVKKPKSKRKKSSFWSCKRKILEEGPSYTWSKPQFQNKSWQINNRLKEIN